jgi:hypothetical protein
MIRMAVGEKDPLKIQAMGFDEFHDLFRVSARINENTPSFFVQDKVSVGPKSPERKAVNAHRSIPPAFYNECYRSLVRQFHVHHGLEDAFGGLDSHGPDHFNKILVKHLRLFRPGGVDE